MEFNILWKACSIPPTLLEWTSVKLKPCISSWSIKRLETRDANDNYQNTKHFINYTEIIHFLKWWNLESDDRERGKRFALISLAYVCIIKEKEKCKNLGNNFILLI